MKIFRVGLLFAVLLTQSIASAQVPERQILQIRLRMSAKNVHERLRTIGKLVRKEEKRQEVWKINDASFSHLIVGFNKDDQLRYVTAAAREDKDAKRVPYDHIGDLKKAQQAGDPKISNFNYQWDLGADKDNPHLLVIAMGRDPKFLSTYTVKSLEDKPAAEEKD